MGTALLVTSCFVLGALFLVVASFLHGQQFRRAARANLAAAGCCLVSGLVLPTTQPVVPFAVLVAATLLGASSLRAARLGRG
jgi:lipopolysaccharide export LptBFGC system permease protein LptF